MQILIQGVQEPDCILTNDFYAEFSSPKLEYQAHDSEYELKKKKI